MSISDVSINSESSAYDSWIEFSKDDLLNRFAVASYRVASFLTDPVCKAHEYFRRFQTVDVLNHEASALSKMAKKISLSFGLVGCVGLALFSTVPGVALRSLAAALQKEPYIYVEGTAEEKSLPKDRSFSLLSWNICCTSGGYSISDGGVLPWAFRIDAIVDRLLEKDADVNCLYETFDANSAFILCEKLKQHGYRHFYFNMGARGFGVSSGIFVASKYKIHNPEFSPFPQDTLVGRTKFSAKGVFAFDLESQGKSFARIHATHLQHSEEPAFPTEEEVDARRRQMEIIADKVAAVQGCCAIVTGDLNLDDEEYRASFWKDRFVKGDDFTEKTWGGDEFSARLVGNKRISPALNLDHLMASVGSVRSIHTSLVETGFQSAIYKEGALSDHAGLLSRITVK